MSMTEPLSGELTTAVCKVMAEVQTIPKTGHNKFHDFKYASDVDLLTAIQPAMAANGLALIQTGIQQTTVPHHDTGSGKPQLRTEVVVTYRLLHTSGDSIQVQGVGFGIDGEDKGIYKALTGALKYALRGIFLPPCEVNGDPDRDGSQATARRRRGAPFKSEEECERVASELAPKPEPPEPGSDDGPKYRKFVHVGKSGGKGMPLTVRAEYDGDQENGATHVSPGKLCHMEITIKNAAKAAKMHANEVDEIVRHVLKQWNYEALCLIGWRDKTDSDGEACSAAIVEEIARSIAAGGIISGSAADEGIPY